MSTFSSTVKNPQNRAQKIRTNILTTESTEVTEAAGPQE
jgi:hypothetical protein